MDPRVERTRQQVMEAAQELLLEGGPGALTYSALAQRSGVGRATLYRHWPERDDLVRDMVAQRIAAVTVEPSGDLTTDLKAAIAIMRRNIATGETRTRFLTILERASWDEESRGLLTTMNSVSPLRLVLEHAVTNGSLPADTDIDFSVSLLMGPLMHRALVTSQPLDDAFVERLVTAFLHLQ